MPAFNVFPSAASQAGIVDVLATGSHTDNPAFILLVGRNLWVEPEQRPVVVIRRIWIGVASVVTLIVLGCTGLQNTLEIRMLQFW
jgi:hypothetical protein